MEGFAERTGLTSTRPPRRYLWTDAFAVCNFIDLARQTGEVELTELALRLVDQVHHVLGQHRPDAARRGWLIGLPPEAGEEHPTLGGLRIGKPEPERAIGEPFDEAREWDRDGQYFHYLSRWMHALDRAAQATGELRFNRWARELAATAYRGFTLRPRVGRPRLMWKMSIDLSRPLVASQGQHDPLDGFLAALELTAHAPAAGPDLRLEIAGLASMLTGHWVTADPLGLGGLLTDAARAAALARHGLLADDALLLSLLAAAHEGLDEHLARHDANEPAGRRVAFRELGLAIGLHDLARIETANAEVQRRLDDLAPSLALAPQLERFWLDPRQQATASWQAHRDINEVMLATCLIATLSPGVEQPAAGPPGLLDGAVPR
jgi:hypothetical protein